MKMIKSVAVGFAGVVAFAAQAQVEAVWLTCRSVTPEKTVVNWKSAQPGTSRVFYGTDAAYGRHLASAVERPARCPLSKRRMNVTAARPS